MRHRLYLAGLMLFTMLGCGEEGEGVARSQATASSATRASPATAPATTQAAGQESPVEAKLYGTWVARDVEAKMGEVKIRLTFKKEGPVKLIAWSDMPLVGQVREKTAPYEVHGNVISSDALRGGTSVQYRFAGDDLIIEYQDGKTVRFSRQ